LPAKGFKSITLKEPVFNKYKNAVKDLNKVSRSKVTLSEFLEWFIDLYEDEMWQLPRLSKFQVYDDKVAINDSKLNEIVEVQVKVDTFYCLSCHSESCIHVGFAYSAPEVTKLITIGKLSRPTRNKGNLLREAEEAQS